MEDGTLAQVELIFIVMSRILVQIRHVWLCWCIVVEHVCVDISSSFEETVKLRLHWGRGSVSSNKMLCINCCHLFVLYEFTECKRGIPTAAAVKFSFQDAISCPRKEKMLMF